jgi:hypothetical protein
LRETYTDIRLINPRDTHGRKVRMKMSTVELFRHLGTVRTYVVGSRPLALWGSQERQRIDKLAKLQWVTVERYLQWEVVTLTELGREALVINGY